MGPVGFKQRVIFIYFLQRPVVTVTLVQYILNLESFSQQSEEFRPIVNEGRPFDL
jgi:hypothetical protein